MVGLQYFTTRAPVSRYRTPSSIHSLSVLSLCRAHCRYVSNVLEELDSPNEWYLDRQRRVLYFMANGSSQRAAATI